MLRVGDGHVPHVCHERRAGSWIGRCAARSAPTFTRNRRRSIADLARRASCRFIVKHPDRRRIEIIELTPARAHDEPNDRGEHDERGERNHDENHAHRARSFGNVVLDHDASTTVNELAGISTAAMSGVITPVTASVAPIRL